MAIKQETANSSVPEEQNREATEKGCCSINHELSERDFKFDVEAFSALANETRYEVLRLLKAADEEVCACQLVPQPGVTQSTISHALGTLHQAGLVERRKESHWRLYTATGRAETLMTAIDRTKGVGV